MTVLCRDCDHVHSTTRNQPFYQWRCMKAPEDPAQGFVNPGWLPEPPYKKCAALNKDGKCSMFMEKRHV